VFRSPEVRDALAIGRRWSLRDQRRSAAASRQPGRRGCAGGRTWAGAIPAPWPWSGRIVVGAGGPRVWRSRRSRGRQVCGPGVDRAHWPRRRDHRLGDRGDSCRMHQGLRDRRDRRVHRAGPATARARRSWTWRRSPPGVCVAAGPKVLDVATVGLVLCVGGGLSTSAPAFYVASGIGSTPVRRRGCGALARAGSAGAARGVLLLCHLLAAAGGR
jgi:hypothetical protein